ncbi:MAG: dihydrodipicolinate reductase, partial [Desulfobacterales bacterium]
MKKIKTMINGIPGNMAVTVARHILADDRFELIPETLTGPEIQESEYRIDEISVRLIRSDA